MKNTIQTNVDLFTLSSEERDEARNIYGSDCPAYIDIMRNEDGEIIKVTREGKMK